jgi:hypothetical protein
MNQSCQQLHHLYIINTHTSTEWRRVKGHHESVLSATPPSMASDMTLLSSGMCVYDVKMVELLTTLIHDGLGHDSTQ